MQLIFFTKDHKGIDAEGKGDDIIAILPNEECILRIVFDGQGAPTDQIKIFNAGELIHQLSFTIGSWTEIPLKPAAEGSVVVHINKEHVRSVHYRRVG